MENARKPDVRFALTAIAIVSVVAAIWAATAFAGGASSSSSNAPSAGSTPVPGYVQDDGGGRSEQDGARPEREDCPEDGDGQDGGESGSSDTTSADV